MIIKGGAAGNVGWWSQHLQRDDTNDRAEVMEISGLLATDLPTALREMEAIAAQSRSHGNFMYQANINPRDSERLTPEQWREAVDTLEKNLGFEGHQRIVVEHEKEGRTHRHVIWNRVDVDTLKVADISGDYRQHQATARELESRFDLSPTPTPPNREQQPDRAPELWEVRAAERSGITPEQVRQDATEAWRRTDSGKAFAAAIEERGYILARGDRRDFCMVDQAGDVHSLARRIEGAKVQDVRERMADIDRGSLPSVADARETQRNRPQPDHQPQPAATPERPIEAINQDHAMAEQERARAEALRRLEALNRADEKKLHEPDSIGQRFADAARDAAQQTRQETREAKQADTQKAWRMNRDAERARVTDAGTTSRDTSGLHVTNAATGLVASLGSFVDALLGGKPALPPEGHDRIRAQRRALAAMEKIRDSMERGENLAASDVSALLPTQLENIKAKGDDYIRELIENVERDRARQRDYGRARER